MPDSGSPSRRSPRSPATPGGRSSRGDPGSGALDQTEAAAANATGDQTAFRNNPALGPVQRTLLLKGDLDRRAHAVSAAMQTDVSLVSVVWNAVDDALSSKETTPFSPWTFGGIGAEVLATLREAFELGWVVLVTADHGHTPFVEGGRKVATSALGHRYGSAPLPGAVRFESGPLPVRPLWLVTRVGSWAGTQHRGWHGGAGIEEVAVPFAFLKPCAPGEGRPTAPLWWWHRPDAVTARPVERSAPAAETPRVARAAASPAPETPRVGRAAASPAPEAPRVARRPEAVDPRTTSEVTASSGAGSATAESWAERVTDVGARRVFVHLERHGSVDEGELLTLLDGPRAVRSFANHFEGWLVHVPFRVRVEMVSGRKRYVKE